jgi:hypothetical protein
LIANFPASSGVVPPPLILCSKNPAAGGNLMIGSGFIWTRGAGGAPSLGLCHTLFLNFGGFPRKSAKNKGAYHPNLPGFKGRVSDKMGGGGGKLCGNFWRGSTGSYSKCPMLTK